MAAPSFCVSLLVLHLGAAQASQPAPGPASQPAAQTEVGASSQPASTDDDPANQAASRPADDSAAPDEEALSRPVPSRTEPSGGEGALAPAESETLTDLIFGPSGPSASQTAGQVTGRPGATENAATLRKGALLVDLALHVDSTIQDGLLLTATQLDAPRALIRVGLFDYLELRAGAIYSVQTTGLDENGTPPPPVTAGLGAITLGGTARILEEDGVWPGMAVLLDSAVPIETLRLSGFSARGLLLGQKTFFQRFQLAGNVGAGWDGVRERFALPYTAVASLDIGLGVGAYAELFGELPLDLDVENLNLNNLGERAPSVWADGGIYVDVGPSLRVDAALGVNALGQQGAWFAEVGLSWLVPGMF